MSLGLDLNRLCDHRVVQEDKVLEDDKVSVILNRPLNNTSDITVRLNDFKRSESFMTEVLTREDVTSQFSNSNKDTIVVSKQIYDGLKIGQLATLKDEVIVRVNVCDEDVSAQFTGTENYFVVQGKPLLKSDNYDFTEAHVEDVVVIHNGKSLSYTQTTCTNFQNYSLTNGSKLGIQIAGALTPTWATFNSSDFVDINQATAAEVAAVLSVAWLSATVFAQSGKVVVRANNSFQISDGTGSPNVALGFSLALVTNDGATNKISIVDATLGRVQLSFVPVIGDSVIVTYFFKASIKSLDAINSTIVLQQKPALGSTPPLTTQDVDVAYFSRVNDGWYLKDSTRSMLPGAKDVVFYRPKNSYRGLAVKEDETAQFTGTENYFQTAHYPILPLYQQFGNTFEQTLYNSLTVFINDEKVQIMRLDAQYGLVALYVKPQPGDKVECTYYYEASIVPDRVTVDYSVDRTYCQKCAQHKYLWDYVVNVLGNYALVKDEFKLKQDLKKIIVTIKGSDHVALWYGTIFETIIGKKLLPEYSKTRISGEITEALSKLKNAQIKQQDYQEVSDREFLDFIQSLTVEQDSVDTTYYKATVDVVTQAGTGFTMTSPIGG